MAVASCCMKVRFASTYIQSPLLLQECIRRKAARKYFFCLRRVRYGMRDILRSATIKYKMYIEDKEKIYEYKSTLLQLNRVNGERLGLEM